MNSDRITIITHEFSTPFVTETIYTVPSGHTFILYSKLASGNSSAYRIFDSLGTTSILTQQKMRENLREIYEAGDSITGYIESNTGTIEIRGMLLDINGNYIPFNNSSSSSSPSSSSSAISSSSSSAESSSSGGQGGMTYYYTVSGSIGSQNVDGNYYLHSGTHGTSDAIYTNGTYYIFRTDECWVIHYEDYWNDELPGPLFASLYYSTTYPVPNTVPVGVWTQGGDWGDNEVMVSNYA